MPRIRITEGSKPVKIKWKDKDSDPDWKSKITESGWTPPADWNVVKDTAVVDNKGIELFWEP